MRHQVYSSQSGRSMLEALGYIMIMIMVTFAAASMVNSGLGKFRMSRIHHELTDLKKVISQRYVAATDYSEVKMSTLCEEGIGPAGVVPNKKKGCNQKGRHIMGGNVEIGNDEGRTFFIKFDGLPAMVCAELGSMVWVINDGSDLDWMDINGTTWKWEFSDTERATKHLLPAKTADVMKACNKKQNVITWHFN